MTLLPIWHRAQLLRRQTSCPFVKSRGCRRVGASAAATKGHGYEETDRSVVGDHLLLLVARRVRGSGAEGHLHHRSTSHANHLRHSAYGAEHILRTLWQGDG